MESRSKIGLADSVRQTRRCSLLSNVRWGTCDLCKTKARFARLTVSDNQPAGMSVEIDVPACWNYVGVIVTDKPELEHD
jgi:hypothetical protein